MLTLEKEQTTLLDYCVVNTSIQETFTAIDRFECFAVDEILLMREQQLYLQAGYKNFSEYCQRELYAWGGYRRINQLLGAKKVIDAVGELGGHIKNERQARPLLRLVKEPEKLKAAVTLALKDNPDPSVSDFAAAAQKVVPPVSRKRQSIQEPLVPKIQEPVVPQSTKVTVSQQSHPRYGDSGVIEADAPNRWQQIVTFADGERLLINNADLDAASVPFPRERTYPAEYTEAIAALKEKHQQCKVSIEDINWVRQQPPSVQQLWLDSVAAEQFGGSAHKLDTNLTYKSLQKAGAALTAQGLFQFEEVFGRLPSGRPGLISYRVRNLHGYYNRFYWESSTSEETNSCDEKAVPAGEKINQPEPNKNHPKVEQIHTDLESFQKNDQKSEDLQRFQNPNNVFNYPLTTYQQPTKVVGMVVGSDAPTESPREEETAHAPLRGASPSRIESASELEELPTAIDCTSLTLVETAPSQSASLFAENQVSGVEAIYPHEDTCSAASVAQNEKSLNSAIANQTQRQVEQSNPTSLSGENQVSGFEPKDCHEGTGSAAPVSLNQSEIFEWLDRANVGECPPLWVIQYLLSSKYYASMRATISKFEKQWNLSVVNYQVQKSSEALFSTEDIAMRSKVRLLRMEKLKMASLVGENPGFDFLQQCCHDDPALQILIKKLLAKFPQWGITCVDGVLVDYER